MARSNLFLVAAPRSGSTELSGWLHRHPEIALCPIKEPHYFSRAQFAEPGIDPAQHNDVDPVSFVNGSMSKRHHAALVRDTWVYEALFQGMTTRWRLGSPARRRNLGTGPLASSWKQQTATSPSSCSRSR